MMSKPIYPKKTLEGKDSRIVTERALACPELLPSQYYHGTWERQTSGFVFNLIVEVQSFKATSISMAIHISENFQSHQTRYQRIYWLLSSIPLNRAAAIQILSASTPHEKHDF